MSTVEFPPPIRPLGELPTIYGVIIYPGFQSLDVFGPLDALNSLSFHYPLQLAVIAETLDPVPTRPPGHLGNPSSNFSQSIVPTHTFDTAPAVDVLIVPGGLGMRDPINVGAAIAYIERIYPTLRYLITVCTGSGLAAQAGILDGRRATTNKRAWARTTQLRPQVRWVAHARWFVDGNIWTSSGVSAGIDVIFAFMGEVYGEEVATSIASFLEYERHTDSAWDPFSDLYNL